MSAAWVFLLDVDNTLVDNDAVKADLDRRLKAELGPDVERLFWTTYDQVRLERDRVDYPEVLRRFNAGAVPAEAATRVSTVVNGIPYDQYRFPGALEALAHLATLGTTVILSDGDPIYQREKIRRAGLDTAVDGRVLITTHKETELLNVHKTYPSDYYAMIDDKPGILQAIKEREPDRFRTIFVAQGHYGRDAAPFSPPPDVTVRHIADLQTLRLDQLETSRRG